MTNTFSGFPQKKMGFVLSFTIFGAASVLMILETKLLIPALCKTTGQEPVLFWFLVAGIGIFIPLLITAALILQNEGTLFEPGSWSERLRFRRLNSGDWIWSVGAIIVIGIISSILMRGLESFVGKIDHQLPLCHLSL